MDNKVKPRISAVITDCLKCPHSKGTTLLKAQPVQCLYAKKKNK